MAIGIAFGTSVLPVKMTLLVPESTLPLEFPHPLLP